MRLILSPRVPGDLEEIADYIAQDSPRQAVRVLHLLHGRLKKIAQQPQLYRIRPEIGAEARLASMGNYIILFRVRGNTVRIERVLYGGRDLVSASKRRARKPNCKEFTPPSAYSNRASHAVAQKCLFKSKIEKRTVKL